ncbi:hypothetical protein LTR56_007765 [Elasticomyces elasticus]|nr:hypothetical protein LTR56_007765 [Elasticomyces elasticus]KAK3661863.1 hypothetical protein LTR22_007237 [Elasticomyces elasticus]KAK4925624.1 hypothetical protein LTR49_007462 [Elasticomyces elasticus]KAK5748591.1 hypothetical protein LTS12_021365 [Elasticomyces elasticus]
MSRGPSDAMADDFMPASATELSPRRVGGQSSRNGFNSTITARIPSPMQRPVDKYSQVANELPGLLATAIDEITPDQPRLRVGVTDALADIRTWATERPENMVKLAKILRAADLLTPINLTSQTQIGFNMAAVDADGQIRRHDAEPEVMRALGSCVMQAWLELGHGVMDVDEPCGTGTSCCSVQ